MAALLEVSPKQMRARVNISLEKVQVHSPLVDQWPDPPPLPPAASAVFPSRSSGLRTFRGTSVGLYLGSRLAIAPTRIDCEGTFRAVLVGMLREIDRPH